MPIETVRNLADIFSQYLERNDGCNVIYMVYN